MSEFFLGQVMMTGFGFAQKYFAQCNGQLLPINQNQALFSLLGTVYGGNGIQTFGLPDLRSRTPAGGGFGSGDYALGQVGGTEQVTLIESQLPRHTHNAVMTTATGSRGSPRGSGATLGNIDPPTPGFYSPTPDIPLQGQPLTQTGNNLPHSNMQPYTTINFNIALSGVFPSRN
ncbi:MAG: microcystin-dependent protein [Sphingomonas sp. 28-66-16]|nr:MAG: microcystin-dependent protein [Sphingomonas sp. 28-66-16]